MDLLFQKIVTILLTALTSSGFMSIVMYKIQRLDRMKDDKEANKTALSLMVRGLCHDKILYLTNKYITRNGITMEEMSNLEALYKPYEAAGGNGACKRGFEACEKLRTITNDEAEELDIALKRKEYGID